MARAKRTKRVKRAHGALAALTALLMFSAFIRLGEHAGQAFARDMPIEEMTEVVAQSPTPEQPDIQMILDALQEREDRVTESERQIRLRFAALEEADFQIQRRLDELRQAEDALRETLALADEAAEKDIQSLVAVYENMKPQEAAALFETMQPSFAAGFLGRMNPQAAAGIVAGLNPDIAHAIVVEIAGRNANVPTE